MVFVRLKERVEAIVLIFLQYSLHPDLFEREIAVIICPSIVSSCTFIFRCFFVFITSGHCLKKKKYLQGTDHFAQYLVA